VFAQSPTVSRCISGLILLYVFVLLRHQTQLYRPGNRGVAADMMFGDELVIPPLGPDDVRTNLCPAANPDIAPLRKTAAPGAQPPVLHTIPWQSERWSQYSIPQTGIPRIIHQTVRSVQHRSVYARRSEASWRMLNPDFEYRIYNDTDIDTYVKHRAPQYVDVWQNLSTVEKSDFWRYLVLSLDGGVYSDSDTLCLQPVASWGECSNAFVGVERFSPDEKERLSAKATYSLQFCQWTLASAPGHPLLAHTVEYVADAIRTGNLHVPKSELWSGQMRVLHRTGPGIFTRAVFDYLRGFNVSGATVLEGGRVGDVTFLPIPAFNAKSHRREPHRKLVWHNFDGSWKTLKFRLDGYVSMFNYRRAKYLSSQNIWWRKSTALAAVVVLCTCLLIWWFVNSVRKRQTLDQSALPKVATATPSSAVS